MADPEDKRDRLFLASILVAYSLSWFAIGGALMFVYWDFTTYRQIEAGVFEYRAAGYRIERITQ